MHTVVQPPSQAIEVAVGYAEREAFEHDLTHVGSAVAVGILEKNEFRRRGDKNTSIPCANRGGKTQVLRKNRAAVHLPIMICVFQQADRAARLALRTEAIRVIAHLDDIHSARGVERQRHGIDHVRFGRKKGNLQSRVDQAVGGVGNWVSAGGVSVR